jgi:cytochrome P450
VPDGPGVWPNIMTFIDGPRRCVGYKLAHMQIKMILYALIRDFEFAPVPDKKIYKWNL